MVWSLSYHPDVEQDLISLGRAETRNIFKFIENNLMRGEPDKLGQSLENVLSRYQCIRFGQTRIIYRIDVEKIEILMIAIGARRHHQYHEHHA